MASARLSERQKKELVQRFCHGESTQALADAFGCSTTTVTRLVRSEMDPEDYAALRDQRQKKVGRDGQILWRCHAPL
jgi:phenylpyruvate tautomerase PptA (4-oxalocrotonate tautomerase family)